MPNEQVAALMISHNFKPDRTAMASPEAIVHQKNSQRTDKAIEKHQLVSDYAVENNDSHIEESGSLVSCLTKCIE